MGAVATFGGTVVSVVVRGGVDLLFDLVDNAGHVDACVGSRGFGDLCLSLKMVVCELFV
jgi:hypothetical protein